MQHGNKTKMSRAAFLQWLASEIQQTQGPSRAHTKKRRGKNTEITSCNVQDSYTNVSHSYDVIEAIRHKRWRDFLIEAAIVARPSFRNRREE